MNRLALVVFCSIVLGGCAALERLPTGRSEEAIASLTVPVPEWESGFSTPPTVERRESTPEGSATASLPVDPTRLAFIEARARQAYEIGRLEVAEGYYLQWIRLKPKDAEPWFQLGNLYSEQGRLHAAERAYLQALRRRDDARTLHNLGLAQVKLGVGALREAQKRLPPNDPTRRETREFLQILLESVGQ